MQHGWEHAVAGWNPIRPRGYGEGWTMDNGDGTDVRSDDFEAIRGCPA